MSVAKIIEINASSKTSVEDAVRSGLKNGRDGQGHPGRLDQ